MIPYLDSDLEIESGVYVAAIQTDGPLFNKEVQIGDIITHIDGKEINKMNDLKSYIYTKKPEENIELTIERNRIVYKTRVKLGYKM